jgi:hypothetical protein
VEGNVIISERDPAVRVHLPKSAEYVGADRWVLYGMADCELHAFVEVDGVKPGSSNPTLLDGFLSPDEECDPERA